MITAKLRSELQFVECLKDSGSVMQYLMNVCVCVFFFLGGGALAPLVCPANNIKQQKSNTTHEDVQQTLHW